MADSTTTRYGFVKPEVAASADTWGSKLNTDMDDVDALLGVITTAGSANAYTLTTGLSLAAYVLGQVFWIKASFANTGAATINVDGLGAKDLRKSASAALASGDIASGDVLAICYDGTLFQVATLSQGRDATLTALAALSWSSATPVLQFTAADTVSLTSAPKVTTLDLGDVTDATIARSGAGLVSIEGVDIVTLSATQTLTNKTLTTPTLTTPTLTTATINGGTSSAGPQNSSETTGVLTSASANKRVVCSGGVTLPSSGMTAGDFVLLDPDGTARLVTRPAAHTMYVKDSDVASDTTYAHNVALAVFHGSSKYTLHGMP